jgi:hypothetical protein
MPPSPTDRLNRPLDGLSEKLRYAAISVGDININGGTGRALEKAVKTAFAIESVFDAERSRDETTNTCNMCSAYDRRALFKACTRRLTSFVSSFVILVGLVGGAW